MAAAETRHKTGHGKRAAGGAAGREWRGAGGRPRPGTRRVVAVQMEFKLLPNLEAIREYILGCVLKAAHKSGSGGGRPMLIALPAWTGLLPLHLYAPDWTADHLEEPIRRYGLALEEWWLRWAREMARQTRTFLIPGSVLIPSSKDRGMLHVSALVGPDGRVRGRAAQTHVTGPEAAGGLMAAAELPVWDAEGIRLGIALGSDLWFPEVGRILALQGATLMVAPTAVAAPYSPWHQMAGLWQQAQGNQVFVLEAGMWGRAGGRALEGRTALAGPVEITPNGSGYYRQTLNSRAADVVAGELDFPRLYSLRREYPIASHFNAKLYERHFPGLYAGFQKKAGGAVDIGTDDFEDDPGVLLA